MFPEKQAEWRERQASKRKAGRIGVKARTPYLRSNLSVVIFQSLIQVGRRFTIRKTIMCNFLQAALAEIITDFAAVDTVFGRIDAKNFTEEFEGSSAVSLEIGQN